MKYVCIVFLVVVFGACVAQTNDSLATTPKFAVRWTPLSLASRFPTIQFGIEYRLKSLNPRWTMSHDLGIVLKTGNDTESYANKAGFKAMTELRYYVTPSGRVPIYISTELYYHQIKYNRTEFIGYDCETGDCTYYQYISWKRNFSMGRASLKLGFIAFLAIPSKRGLFFDLSGGIAYGVRRSKDQEKPPLSANANSFGTNTIWSESQIVENGERLMPVFSLRVGYKFK